MKEEIAREKHFPSQPTAGPDSGRADHESKSPWLFFFFPVMSSCPHYVAGGLLAVAGEGGGGVTRERQMERFP